MVHVYILYKHSAYLVNMLLRHKRHVISQCILPTVFSLEHRYLRIYLNIYKSPEIILSEMT